jgi:hypothetical protein
MRASRKGVRKDNSHATGMDEFQPTSGFDCGLGLFLNRSARKTYNNLSPDLKHNFDRFLDYLFDSFPDWPELMGVPGEHSYEGEGLRVIYLVEESTHPDVKCFVTILEINPLHY